MHEAYPLHWPEGWPVNEKPKHSQFNTSFEKARTGLFAELRRLGASDIVLSTNIPLRKDGMPYARQFADMDCGVAVYFRLNDKLQCFPCDKWKTVGDNIHAIAKTIEAMRGIDRWGSKAMLDAAFSGFQALPEPQADNEFWWLKVLGVEAGSTLPECKKAYKAKAFEVHPDRAKEAPEAIGAIYELNRAILAAEGYFASLDSEK